jgi:uncharacterized protein
MTSNRNIKPFIKKFCDSGFFYIYDVNTNQVVEVEKPVFTIIDEFVDDKVQSVDSSSEENYKPRNINQIMDKIKKAKSEYGLFSNFKPKHVTMGLKTADGVRQIHSKGLKQMVIEITRDCSLNCAYCPTSGKYSHPETFKTHMSRETCRTAVDFFCERTLNSEETYITFYGGEPLLSFELIRETVNYVKKKYDKKKIVFNLTTNATLFTKEILDFFIENNFYILVSLDGPKQINDRYRRFKNGKGTFNRIMKNLKSLKEYNKQYFLRRVSISSVLAPPYDKIEETIDFFSNDKTLDEIKDKIKSNLVDTRDTSFIEDFNLKESVKDYSTVSNKFIERLKNAILNNYLNHLTIEKTQIFNILYNLSMKPIKKLYDFVTPLGACHIAMRRVFVTTNGDFYICERAGDKTGDGALFFDFFRGGII